MKMGSGSKIYAEARVLENEDHVVELGKNCSIMDGTFVAARKLVMEDGAQISPHAVIGGGGEVHLGKYSIVGFGAILIPATDQVVAKYMAEAAAPTKREILRGSITLGEGVYVGSGAIICVSKREPNIKIGDFSVIGALSYIDTSVPPNMIVYPKQELVYRRRFGCNQSTRDGCLMARCPISGANWENCGYLKMGELFHVE